MSLTFPDHIEENELDNLGGIGRQVALAFLRDITTLPDPALRTVTSASAGDLEDMATITEDIVMATGKKFMVFDVLPDMGELKDVSVGKSGTMGKEIELSFFVPGTSAKVAGLERMLANAKLVALVPDNDADMTVKLAGNNQFPLRLSKVERTTGKKPGDDKGATFIFKYADLLAPPTFEGGVKLDADAYQPIFWLKKP